MEVQKHKMELFERITDEKSVSHLKVTIVGVGQVGMAAAYSILLEVFLIKYCFATY